MHSLSSDAFSSLPFPMACRTEEIILGFTDSVIGVLQRLILQIVTDIPSFPHTAYVCFPLKSTKGAGEVLQSGCLGEKKMAVERRAVMWLSVFAQTP